MRSSSQIALHLPLAFLSHSSRYCGSRWRHLTCQVLTERHMMKVFGMMGVRLCGCEYLDVGLFGYEILWSSDCSVDEKVSLRCCQKHPRGRYHFYTFDTLITQQ
ncbi:hypothetical protein EJ06DRAFT_236066 [Trichodelitschia bisporula]|uniref:Uncharacterized protein n=1 Tax=Trichodelitschia bisporula TaxID=703511 RepID=A0A6G1HKC9_9PEZI|nr:hypothetical protein EJ06DRAFT_236066 [Trichodelitschia bisporula]